MGYFIFWPRYTFEIFGYEEVKLENEHSQWWINVINTGPGYEIEKVNIYAKPYTLQIHHAGEIEIDKVDILKDQKNVLTLTNKERFDRQNSAFTNYNDIEFNYHDYNLIIYYSVKGKDEQAKHSIKVPLKTDYVKEKVSWMEMAQGI
jgi:hypothetical protein